MLKLFGYGLGSLLCFDGAMGTLSARRWQQLWRDASSLVPSSLGQYANEVVTVTQRYQIASPKSMKALFLAELACGVLILRLTSKVR